MTKPTDLLVILTAAVLTALVAAPILSPALSHAEGEEVLGQNGVQVSIGHLRIFSRTTTSGQEQPLTADGLELTLKLDQESYAAGEKPVLTLVAVNKSDKKCKTKAKVVMSSMEAIDGLSRAMPMPLAVYTKEVEIEVAAGQTVRLPLTTGYAVTASSMVNLTISVGELFQPAGSFAVAAPAQVDERVQVAKQ